MPGAPMWMRPQPAFLSEVCCESGTRCCMKDENNFRFPAYTCCPSATHECHVTDGKGECHEIDLVTMPNGLPPLFTAMIDRMGRCPDGLPPASLNPETPLICSSNKGVNDAWVNSACPTDTYCAKDRNPNQNTGVCCRDSHCPAYGDCQTCVRISAHTLEPTSRPCMWLTQGDGIGGTTIPNTYDSATGMSEHNGVGGRCVATCETFPEKSCILPHASGSMCPMHNGWKNGTDYNVGSCERRCGMTGTGRSSRINVGMMAHTTPSNMTTPCCAEQPNDYCCSWDGTLADHCGTGRANNGPVCGVPISGTPNNFFNSGPGVMPPSMTAVAIQQVNGGYGGYPTPFGGGFGYPMGFAPGMYGGGPFGGGFPGFGGMYNGPFNSPMFYRNYGENTELSGEDALKAAQAENDRMFFYPAMGPNFMRPPIMPPPPPPPPAAVDQQPSAFVCSCDDDCLKDENADCCSDFFETCGAGDNETPSLADIPIWWSYDS